MPRLSLVMRGIKSQQAKQGRQSRPRLPITPTILRQLRRVWDPSCYGRLPQRVSSVLWEREKLQFHPRKPTTPTAHLSFNDVAVDAHANPTVMEVRIKASKTDPFRMGVNLYIGRTNNDLCPIAALMAYLAIRGRGEGPLFRFKNGQPLTRERLVAKVREALSASGIDHSKYAGHSFRIGAATTAAQCGIPDSTIQLLGRWESSAYLLYIRTPRKTLADLSTVLSRSTS